MINDLNQKTKKSFYNLKKCPGCGDLAKIQNDQKLCSRCFRIVNYNDFKRAVKVIEPKLLINSLGKNIRCYFVVIDIFNFQINQIKKILEDIDPKILKILLLNKMDLLEKSSRISKFSNKINLQLKMIKNLKILPICALKGDKHMNTLANLIIHNNRDSAFIGLENAGKSTIIKHLLNQKNIVHNLISSRFPGTTSNLIKFKINDLEIIDTPGIRDENSLRVFADDPFHKWWTFKDNINPRIFQLDGGQSLFFGNLIRLNFISGTKTSFTIYTNPNINVFRTKTINAKRVNERSKTILKWPLQDCQYVNDNFTQTIVLKNNLNKVDLEISDIGVISLISKGQTITINSPLKNPIKVRNSLF